MEMQKGTDPRNPQKADHFTFQRMGGINQLVMHNDFDWQNLENLDPKLWMALSCPIQGLEYSHETLDMLDADHDGRIRAQEVRDAVNWACQRLVNPSQLVKGSQELRASELRSDTPEGTAIISALKIALQQYGKEDTDALSLAEAADTFSKASSYAFNGDGVVTLECAQQASADKPELGDISEFVRLGLAIVGGKKDATGRPGLDADLGAELLKMASALGAWRKKVQGLDLPLGDKTGEAWSLLQELRPKLDDFFNRCQFAAYAPETAATLGEGAILQQMAADDTHKGALTLDQATLLELPLARIAPDGKLNLIENVNPAWKDKLALFASLFAAELPKKNILEQPVWEQIWQRFAEYAATLDEKPDFALPPEDAVCVALPGLPELCEAPGGDALGRAWLATKPNIVLDGLDDKQLEWLEAQKDNFAQVVKMDLDAPSLASFQDLYKLSLYNAHLYTFLMNFVSFMDFYNPDKKAIFQTGTLYLNSIGCMLSVPVTDIDAHASLAVPSHLCLIYCECTRKEDDGSVKTMTIASALTQGSVDDLLDGRHGLFIDNDGKEWDSRIVRIIHNPVSIREAVWSPYRRLAAMASQQIQKFVSKKEEDATQALTDHATTVAQGGKPAEPKAGFDFAKGAGIFAALGLALSAVSAAFAYIANSLASLGWYWPLALILVFICISGPSVILAWLKLRKRTLGPLLDASGWAVNQGAPINLAMGASLTSVGKLPPNATLDLHDPYSLPGKMLRRKWKIRFWVTVILLALAAIGCFVLYCYLFGEPLWLFWLRAVTGI